jgi:hypothetical protein
MAEEKDSLLNEYAEKSSIKREVKKKRKEEKGKNNETPKTYKLATPPHSPAR